MKYKDKNEERAWEMFRRSVGPRVWTMGDLGLWFSIRQGVEINKSSGSKTENASEPTASSASKIA